jgi:plasmid replication initiation protein
MERYMDEKALVKPTLNSVVTKTNELIENLAKFTLSELRLISYCLSHYDARSPENRTITARVDDLADIFVMDKKSAYAVVRKTMLGINAKPYEYIGDDDYEYFENWFTGFAYKKGDGKFKFRISPDMQPHLLGLDGCFTSFRLKDVYQFQSPTAWKLYENLARWRTAGRWAVSLDEFKHNLGIAGKYPRWDSLRQRVIDPSLKEINAHTDINVEYTTEKDGRPVVGLVFLIDKKVDPEVINLTPREEKVYKLLLGHGMKAKMAQDFSRQINSSDRADIIISKLPGMVERAKNSKESTQKYLTGALKLELNQGRLPGIDTPPAGEKETREKCFKKKGPKCTFLRELSITGIFPFCDECRQDNEGTV